MVRTLVRNGHRLTIRREADPCEGWRELIKLKPLLLRTKQDHMRESVSLFEEYDHDLRDLHVYRSMASVCYVLSRYITSVENNEYYKVLEGCTEDSCNYCTCCDRPGLFFVHFNHEYPEFT